MSYTSTRGRNYARLYVVGADFALESSYDGCFLAAFKNQVPQEGRRWDGNHKRWLVAPQYAETCAKLAEDYLSVSVNVPKAAAPAAETRLLRLEYLGRCKERDNGTASAFGWADGSWSAIFPETVLREWFAAEPQRPDEMPTLYAVLAAKPGARFDELRANYRRLAKQWHPDVCREPNAAETFKAIQHAYEVLQDDAKRKKYDAGLALQHSIKRHETTLPLDKFESGGYRSPLRCGWVLAEGVAMLGRFVVAKIIEWQDILDEHGRTMVVSWPMGAETFEVVWQ